MSMNNAFHCNFFRCSVFFHVQEDPRFQYSTARGKHECSVKCLASKQHNCDDNADDGALVPKIINSILYGCKLKTFKKILQVTENDV